VFGSNLSTTHLHFLRPLVFSAVRRKLDHKIFNCSAPKPSPKLQASLRCFNEDPSHALFSIIGFIRSIPWCKYIFVPWVDTAAPFCQIRKLKERNRCTNRVSFVFSLLSPGLGYISRRLIYFELI
jgi:hypothetical protein